MDDREFMGLALEEARQAAQEGEVPVGALIVRDGKVVCSAHNRVEALKLGTAHAELLAVNRASELLGMWRLDGCTLYVTKEPCAMCAGALLNARVPRLVFGCSDPKMGAAGGYVDVTCMPESLHKPEVISGVLEEECRELLKDFFRRRRACVARDKEL